MKRGIIAIYFGTALLCHAQELICKLEPPARAHDHSIQINFSSRAEWDFSDFARFEDLYIREGKVLYLPFGKDTIENVAPIRLKHAEVIRLYRPHEGCSIEAVVESSRAGLIVKWGFAPTGSTPMRDQTFLPVRQL